MRLRIQTQQPLPELKAWFVPRPISATSNTILDLKRALCHVKLLLHENLQSENIRLLLDGFELLDDLTCDEVLRDGDLVFIQLSQEPRVNIQVERNRTVAEDHPAESALKKRKKSFDVEATGRRQIKRRRRESSSSSESTPSPSSSGTSQSEDDSSESSTTSSSSSNESSSKSFRRHLLTRKGTYLLPGAKTPAVAPGYGKPSTQSRNRRRRLKRKFEKEAKDAERAPPERMSAANSTSLGQINLSEKFQSTLSSLAVEDEEQAAPEPSGRGFATSQSRSASVAGPAFDNANGEIMMVSLRNKNKKKNFRHTMAAPSVRKIVFDENGERHPSSSTPTTFKSNSGGGGIAQGNEPMENMGDSAALGSTLPARVVPPSELAAQGLLPSNMFVTSVEFGQKFKKKRKPRGTYEKEQVSNEFRNAGQYADREDDELYEDADIHLSYGEEMETREGADAAAGEDSQPHLDWKVAEAGWDQRDG
ncbi:hypothetical protein APHAL10511_007924 [Amanita phalloides]|nr:hypothetical protein APHAL10511_007924 [Amanita phalloides]